MPQVSVIIPVFNGEHTIRKAVDSVLNQTFINFELLIIDDGSTDKTVEILSNIPDPRLHIHSYPNRGVSVNRNRGLELASGAYIAFLDQDDYWSEDKLACQVQALTDNPSAAVAYSWTHYIDDAGQFLFEGHRFTQIGDLYSELLVANYVDGGGSNLLFRQEIIRAVGGFNSRFDGVEDWELHIRIAKQGYHFVCVPRVHVYKRESQLQYSNNIDTIEQKAFQLIEHAFANAPQHLHHLKRDSQAYLTYYLLTRTFRSFPSKNKSRAAFRYLTRLLQIDPSRVQQSMHQRWFVRGLAKAVVGLLVPNFIFNTRHPKQSDAKPPYETPCKVLLLSQPLNSGGGAEKLLADFTNMLADEMTFVLAYPEGFPVPKVAAFPIRANRVPLNIRWGKSAQNKLDTLLTTLYRLNTLRKLVATHKPDVIISNSVYVWHHLLVLLRMLYLTTKPIVLWFQNPVAAEGESIRGASYVRFMRCGMRWVDHIILPTKGLADDLQAIYPIDRSKVAVISNGVPIESMQRMAEDEVFDVPFSGTPPIVLTIGRLESQKNQALLIRAFAYVLDVLEANLVIIGAGSAESALRSLTQELQIEDHVHFLGWRSNPYKYLKRATLFALSSDYEGFGIVLVEAMACGSPIVSTDCPFGPREILDHGRYGVLTPVGDENALATAITTLLQDDQRRQSFVEAGKKRALQFEIKESCRQYRQLLYNLKSGSGGLSASNR